MNMLSHSSKRSVSFKDSIYTNFFGQYRYNCASDLFYAITVILQVLLESQRSLGFCVIFKKIV